MTKDELITARIEDKITQCRDGYYVTSTGFLDTHEQALAISASRHAAGVRTFMYGGYDDAERRMLVCVPKDIPMSDEEAVEGLLRILRNGSRDPRRSRGKTVFRRMYQTSDSALLPESRGKELP